MRRGYFAAEHKIPANRQYAGYAEILAEPKFADACFVCTQDNLHFIPATQAMAKGYHLFLEKPMAITPEDCIQLAQSAKAFQVRLMIGHVLRYTSFFATIKHKIEDGSIGDVVTIQHNENVSFWHQAHSYVRGNWRNVATASPMILAKSCHDLDILSWLVGNTPTKVSSFGSLFYFKSENAPSGAPKYCSEGCPVASTCVYQAEKVYLKAPDWMKLPVSNDMSEGAIRKALQKGPYGRCVFHCDNDVVDHQVTILEFAKGITAAFTMTAFTHENTRTIKVMGSLGEIRGHMDKHVIEIHTFGSDKGETIDTETSQFGHGGGDNGIMEAFIALVETGANAEIASADAAVTSHLMAFAAETSRVENRTIDFASYVQSFGG
jgi:predicted dehydrogenase